MTSKERVLLLVDGSNLYYRIKGLSVKQHPLIDFNYSDMAVFLANGRRIVGRNYYIGTVKAPQGNVKGQKLRVKQQQLFSHLLTEKFVVIHGVLMKVGNVYHEKGVDVRIAVDIVCGAYDDTYDTAILLSSDTDLIPAIKIARKKGKKVEYIGFANKPSYALQKNSDLSRLLIKSEVENFIK